MRHGRAKAARKTLQFFERTIGIRPPYHVLLDGPFVVAVVQYHLGHHNNNNNNNSSLNNNNNNNNTDNNLAARLDRLLQHAAVHLAVPRTCLLELERLARKKNAAASVDQQDLLRRALEWARQNCTVLTDIPAAANDKEEEELLAVIGGFSSDAGRDIWRLATATSVVAPKKQPTTRHHHQPITTKYFVASQDEELLDVLRRSGRVPIIRLARGSVLLLEQPSKAATSQATQTEVQKYKGRSTLLLSSKEASTEQALVHAAHEQERQERRRRTANNNSSGGERRKHKAKGPNPLSCKKKRSAAAADATAAPKRKRQRRRKTTNVAGANNNI